MRFIDLIGRRYSRLLVQGIHGRNETGHILWDLLCDCGEKRVAESYQLNGGTMKSCGCLRIEQVATLNRTHAQSKSRDYFIWNQMRQRCNRESHKSFPYYGGRGIKVCKEWDSFEVFMKDMGPRPPGYSIERRDVNGDYRPDNCEWIPLKQQAKNRRNSKGNKIKCVQ